MGIYFTVNILCLTLKIDLNICRMIILDKCVKKTVVKFNQYLTKKEKKRDCIVHNTKRMG